MILGRVIEIIKQIKYKQVTKKLLICFALFLS